MLKPVYLIILCLIIALPGRAQLPGSTAPVQDSTLQPLPAKDTAWLRLARENSYLNYSAPPESLAVQQRKPQHSDALFYLLLGIVAFFGIIRTVYVRYFDTLFRVFFNSSLRQSQLTDQLLQSKLPALFFNLLFLLSSAVFVYLLVTGTTQQEPINWTILGICAACILIIYAGKYFVLRISGWVTGYEDEADAYIFVVFLINKILGVCLLPVTVVLSFSLAGVIQVVAVVSIIFVVLMILLRFFRSYGILRHRLRVNGFHFFLYVFALEILPLLIIYKAANVFLIKNL